jgi:hypothetical protein
MRRLRKRIKDTLLENLIHRMNFARRSEDRTQSTNHDDADDDNSGKG